MMNPAFFHGKRRPQVLRHQDLRQRAHRRGGEPAAIPRGATEGADLRRGEVAWQMAMAMAMVMGMAMGMAMGMG